ncbi:unnamed protein product, partial [Ixodes pacificus]
AGFFHRGSGVARARKRGRLLECRESLKFYDDPTIVSNSECIGRRF